MWTQVHLPINILLAKVSLVSLPRFHTYLSPKEKKKYVHVIKIVFNVVSMNKRITRKNADIFIFK